METANGGGQAGRYSSAALYTAAMMYYREGANQAEIADRLKISRASVSRLLTEARRSGIVQIEVHEPRDTDRAELEQRLADFLKIDKAYLSAPLNGNEHQSVIGVTLAPAASRALREVGLLAGDVLLVSSGRTVYEIAQQNLPQFPGVVVAPTVGGQESPDPWFQTNETTRALAAKIGGHPRFLYAPALPGPDLERMLRAEPVIRRVLALWEKAECALVGVGAPPLKRESVPEFVPMDAASLKDAVGDMCTRFFDRSGSPVDYPGSDRLIALGLEALARVPVTIAAAVGRDKSEGITAAARAGYFNRLVTDQHTAESILAD
ncbi:sugar-binding transcriptional regulator [Spelaeicoccus albus]|uniref:DNA-binding transcriptional regulator LsrR (DeoR family) n=1 Tax=Spelaeicoccus albus TaxID=1280376 RepID=A0A7Z0D5D7_9MICO|nr:sugar-binding domain-containing protein [Spelaeicoccus albus]NYI69209.1 DNA-binding transcriptional regulator LsrR (DeoR family) [Spelaeicoccus albus]